METKHIPINKKALNRILRYVRKNPSSFGLEDDDLYDDGADEQLVPDDYDTEEICKRYDLHPQLLELVQHSLKEQMSMASQYRDKWFIENAEEAIALATGSEVANG